MTKKLSFISLSFLTWICCFYSLSQSIEWQKTIGGTLIDRARHVSLTLDDGFLIGGDSESSLGGNKSEGSRGGLDYWVVKLNSDGSIGWQKTLGGSASDYLKYVQQTAVSRYFLAGYSNSNTGNEKAADSKGLSDFWIIKLYGTSIDWQKTIGASLNDQLFSAQQTVDGGYILGGRSESNISSDKTQDSRGGFDFWVVKVDSLGNIEWDKTLGGSAADELYSIVQTNDGGYLLGGNSASGISGDKTEASKGGTDYWVIKLDNSGALVWQKTIGGSSEDLLTSAIQTSDGGYIIGGYSGSNISGNKTENSKGLDDIWIVKLDKNGTIEWQKTIGGSDKDQLNSIKQMLSGKYLLGGSSLSSISGDKTQNSNGDWDYWYLIVDSNGSIEEQMTIGGSTTEGLFSSTISDDGGFVLTGYSKSGISGNKTEANFGYEDYWAVKIAGCNTKSSITASACASYQGPSGALYTSTGTYYDIIPNSAGCDSIITLDLTISSFTASVTVDDSVFTADLSNSTYQWIDCSTMKSTGETTQSITVSDTGNYAVIITKDGCTDTSSCYSLTSCNTTTSSISELVCRSYKAPSGTIYTSTGIYNDTINNSGCGDSIITLDLTVIFPVTPIVTIDDSVFTVDYTDYNYQWINCNTMQTTGDTTQSITVSDNGSYAVIVSIKDCSDTSLCYSLATSIENSIQSNSLHILYPNPTNDVIVFEWKNNKIFDIEIYDIFGKEIKNVAIKIYFSQATVCTAKLSNGVYFYKMKNEEGKELFFGNFIKQ